MTLKYDFPRKIIIFRQKTN